MSEGGREGGREGVRISLWAKEKPIKANYLSLTSLSQFQHDGVYHIHCSALPHNSNKWS